MTHCGYQLGVLYMSKPNTWGALSIAGLTVVAVLDCPESRAADPPHAVFVMTNDATSNEVIAYSRGADGALSEPRRFHTRGRGSGGKVDPLAAQGSLHLTQDGSHLLAVNAASGTLSLFRVEGVDLRLLDVKPTGGAEPNAVAQFGRLVYALNTAGSSSVVGFYLEGEQLTRIESSPHYLSGNNVGSASVAFSPNGRLLLVTEKTTNRIDAFPVQSDGSLGDLVENSSAGPGVFALSFTPRAFLIVSEVGPGAPNEAAMSSYSVNPDGAITVISQSVPTLGTANCWNAITPNGRYAYASNAGSSTISGFSIGPQGQLTGVGSTVVAANPPGSTNIDIAISSDGLFLYSLNSASGDIAGFAINPSSGLLVGLGTVASGLPQAGGLNGIAAN
jgi:6-phosphogluconolactonase